MYNCYLGLFTRVFIVYVAILCMLGCGGGETDVTAISSISSVNSIVDTEEVTASEQSDVQSAESLNRHNVLLIIADDLGVDSLGLYPYSTDVAPTPNIDNLAKQGVTFDYVWATPVCTTSRATILTGAHGIHSGVDENAGVLTTDDSTLANFIKLSTTEHKVNSAAFGKWHLAGNNGSDDHPNQVGFDYFSGNMKGNVGDYFNWSHVIDGQQQSQTDYHTTVITDEAIDWISQQTQQWFAYVAYASPHTPLHLPPQVLHSYTDLNGSDEDITAQPRRYFNAMIESLDSEIGRLLNGLSSSQRANTTIIFMGDNGTGNQVSDGEVFPSRHVKGSLFEGGVRVPMVIAGAGVDRTNTRTQSPVNSTDLYATIVELVGQPLPQYKNSYSIAGWLRGDGELIRDYNYSELNSARFSGYAVSNGAYKLIVSTDGDLQLYDISSDFTETDNLKDEPALQDVVNSLLRYGQTLREASH